MREYEARDAALRSIGFNSYQAYLLSDLWKSIRRRAMKKAKRDAPFAKTTLSTFTTNRMPKRF